MTETVNLVRLNPTTAAVDVQRDALVAVGTFEPSTGEIILTGPHSAAAVADWLDARELDSARAPRRFCKLIAGG